jgi:hypothetical protein
MLNRLKKRKTRHFDEFIVKKDTVLSAVMGVEIRLLSSPIRAAFPMTT